MDEIKRQVGLAMRDHAGRYQSCQRCAEQRSRDLVFCGMLVLVLFCAAALTWECVVHPHRYERLGARMRWEPKS